jgi:hypothetical protein
MPKLSGESIADARPKPTAAKRTRGRAKKKTVKKKGDGRPAIPRSKRDNHCTPLVVAKGVIYPVLGDPVDLDPCSNNESIVRAKRKIILKPGDDPLGGGLVVPWNVRTVFVNPPYGENIQEWIKKIIVEHRLHGCEIIALLPAHVSASWFDMVVATSQACFFWGPGVGNRRVKFRGNENSATFHSALAYWGPNLPKFTRVALRYCHPWFPEHDLRFARALCGDVQAPEGVTTTLAAADTVLTLSRNDDIAAALASLGSASLGDILDAGPSILQQRLRGVSAYELGTALLYAARSDRQPWLDHRVPRDPSITLDPRQLGFDLDAPLPLGPEALHAKPLDERIFDEIARGTAVGSPPSARELKERLVCTQGELRGAIGRLRTAQRIAKTGRTQGARYIVAPATGEEGNQHATRTIE